MLSTDIHVQVVSKGNRFTECLEDNLGFNIVQLGKTRFINGLCNGLDLGANQIYCPQC